MATKREIEAARDALRDRGGIDIALPWEGSLDDLEQERFNGLMAAVEAVNQIRNDERAAKRP